METKSSESTTQTKNDLYKWSDSTSNLYDTFRPEYTADFYRTLLDYHRRHNGSWDACHDAATGTGLVAQYLTQYFSIVYASDLTEDSVNSVRDRYKDHPRSDRLKFEAHRAEEMDLWLPSQGVDMVTIAEAIHWTDPEKVVTAAANVLKPGGTLAVWCYGGQPFFLDNNEASEAFEHILAQMLEYFWKQERLTDSVDDIVASGLDVVAIDESLFADETRVKWCSDKTFVSRVSGKKADLTSRVGKHAVVKEIHDPSMWYREVDLDWCRGFVRSLDPSNEWAEKENESVWTELKAALAGKEKHSVSFPAALIMATRRH